MAESYRTDYLPIPDQAGFTRAPLRQPLFRALQENAQHLYGTRISPLLVEQDLWAKVTAALPAAHATVAQWHVTVPPGVTVLFGTVLWAGFQIAPEPNTSPYLDVRFQTERGGAGVAAGLDTVTSSAVIDTLEVPDLANGPPGGRSAWDNLRVHDRSNTGNAIRNVAAKFLDGDAEPRWVAWTPDLSTSNEQRILLQARSIATRAPWIWGVYVVGAIPQEA